MSTIFFEIIALNFSNHLFMLAKEKEHALFYTYIKKHCRKKHVHKILICLNMKRLSKHFQNTFLLQTCVTLQKVIKQEFKRTRKSWLSLKNLLNPYHFLKIHLKTYKEGASIKFEPLMKKKKEKKPESVLPPIKVKSQVL